jgi:hypothetical protein
LTANPAIANVVPGAKAYLTLSAHLATAQGTAVAGMDVAFSAGGAKLCSAKTDSNGDVSCGGLSELTQAVLAQGYDAAFAGGGGYTGSQAHGPLLIVSGRLLP